jgi:hypothetical protein
VSDPFPDALQQRDMRAITADGVCFSAMVGLGESYVPAFALAIGLGDVAAGLVATVPMLVGAFLQLVTPFAVRHLASYRRWVVACAALQALSFLPLAFGALVGRVSVVWMGVATVAYWAFGMATGPAWNAWVTSLVPAPLRELFFARRNRAAQAALLVALIGAGLALETGRENGAELYVFALLFAGALLARLLSARFLAAQSERVEDAQRHQALGPIAVWRRLRGADSLRVLRYLLAMQLFANIAAPFFTPYMLKHLSMSYGEFMTLTASAFVARVAVLPLLGRIAQVAGAQRLLWLGGLGIVPLPALWLVSDAFSYLLAVQLLAGCAWASIELATTLAYFEGIEESDRASVLTVFNLANAVAIALGSLIGAQILAHFDASSLAYVWLFAASTTGRLLAAALLRGTPTSREAPELSLRTLAVRPAGGTVQRPILASMAPQAPESPVPRGSEE